MRDFDSEGKVRGLFEEVCERMLELDPSIGPSNMRLEDGFYVTDCDAVIRINSATIYRLTRDLGGQPEFLKDLETGRLWRWTSEWTPYYSDGTTVNRPCLAEE